MSNEKPSSFVDIKKYAKNLPNIDRATSTVLENSVSIFLPMTRIDKSNIYKKFISNNQVLEIENDLLVRVEIRDRLLGQSHKDLLEVLLTLPRVYSKTTEQFRVETTAYELTKKLKRNLGKKQWVIEKLKELSGSTINLYFDNYEKKEVDMWFNFIESGIVVDGNKITINFTQTYTLLMLNNSLLDYSEYIDDIMGISEQMERIQKELELKRGINSEFIKAVVRYVLTNNGKNSRIQINNLVKKLDLKKIMGEKELSRSLTDLRREPVIDYLKSTFGIFLEKENTTINFNKKDADDKNREKKHYHIDQGGNLFS